MRISDSLLQILVCPKCRQQVTYLPEKDALTCDACALSYPVRDQIPIMLVDEANPCE